jgi:hypothetical protein
MSIAAMFQSVRGSRLAAQTRQKTLRRHILPSPAAMSRCSRHVLPSPMPDLLRRTLLVISLLGVGALASPGTARAIRPFVTDDARVVGGGLGQVESWLRADRLALQHWVLLALGPVEPLELTVGGVHGAGFRRRGTAYVGTEYAGAGPLVQVKALILEGKPDRYPSVAASAGLIPALGSEGFAPGSLAGYGYAAVTQSFGKNDRVLLHGNVGFYVSSGARDTAISPTWGVGAQVRAFAGLHPVGELFSGDPYAASAGGAFQVGFRYIFNDTVQMDSTVGRGIWGSPPLPLWGTAGIRVVTPRLW